jgi:NADP-dependent 3-hydroxy acid dehydrogenase YdfG
MVAAGFTAYTTHLLLRAFAPSLGNITEIAAFAGAAAFAWGMILYTATELIVVELRKKMH